MKALSQAEKAERKLIVEEALRCLRYSESKRFCCVLFMKASSSCRARGKHVRGSINGNWAKWFCRVSGLVQQVAQFDALRRKLVKRYALQKGSVKNMDKKKIIALILVAMVIIAGIVGY